MNELPSGTAAWLPDDAGRMREVEGRIRAVFDRRGYREVRTPAFEFAETIEAGFGGALADRLFRFTDVTGRTLALRPEMTTPCARLFATTIGPKTDGPVRLFYTAEVWRQGRAYEGAPREFRQVGAELYRVEGAEGDAEVVALAVEALEAAGLGEFHVEIGHVGLVRSLGPSAEDLAALHRKDAAALPPRLAPLARLFGGPEVLDEAAGLSHETEFARALRDLGELHAALPAAARRRVGFDLAVVREIEYYNGAVFEVLAPGAGRPVAGGGRYDGLTAAFGLAAPATGFSTDLEALLPLVS